MSQFVMQWYIFLSQLSQGLIVFLDSVIRELNVPVLSAVLFGVIGATSPCQLTTNLGALAYVSRQTEVGRAFTSTLAYVLGKVVVYTLAGGVAIYFGVQLQAASVPVVVVARKALGPLMILVGLLMLGALRLPVSLGQRLSARLEARLVARGHAGAFLLGLVFSLAFCPTLFWLFFGLTIPLALRSPGGWSFPGLFAVGTAVPLLVVAAIVSAGVGMAEALLGRMTRIHGALSKLAGGVFILAGTNDTITYWWL